MTAHLFAGETKDKKLSYNELRHTLKITHEECEGYLQRAKQAEDQCARLEKKLDLLIWRWNTVIEVLNRVQVVKEV